MSNRFENKKTNKKIWFFSLLPYFIFLFIMGCLLFGIQSIGHTTAENQLESLKTALSRSITQCYAVEGMYPPNLDYLKEHYGLVYDEDAFLVDYQPIGTNISPEVTVLPRSESQTN